MQVGRKDPGILIDGPVLDYDVLLLGDFNHVLEALVEEINLEIERPPLHIFVEISEIGIKIHGLELGGPAIMGGQHLGKRGFAAAYVSGDSYMHNGRYFFIFPQM